MGTSSSQRSPSTPEWERVRELYRQPDPDPSQILSRIVSALDSETRAGLSDAAVTCCLDRVLDTTIAASVGELGTRYSEPESLQAAPAVAIAAGVRDAAEQIIIDDGLSSRFGDLALDAAGTTILATAEEVAGPGGILRVPYPQIESTLAGFYEQDRTHDLAGSFFSHDFDQVFRYFVARDISDFVGTEAIPDVSTSSQLEDRIALQCRRTTGQIELVDYEPRIREALRDPDPNSRRAQLQDFLGEAVDTGLDALAAAGGAA